MRVLRPWHGQSRQRSNDFHGMSRVELMGFDDRLCRGVEGERKVEIESQGRIPVSDLGSWAHGLISRD